MKPITKMQSVSQFCEQRGQRAQHPLVAILDQSKSKPVTAEQHLSELYIIFLKELKCGELRYGRQHYDYQDGTLLFISPGQVFGIEDSGQALQPTGWAMVFHPDLVKGTHLGRHLKDYNFFSYQVNEALHLSEKERQVVVDNLKKIGEELEHPIDKHSRILVVSGIELLLNYCMRYYDRQFITRNPAHSDILARFEQLLDDYFASGEPQVTGLPTVKFCADALNISPNYFGDLIKKETGKSAQEYIHFKLMDLAKLMVLDSSKSISEVAYQVGFKYPQHFTRLFKQLVGQSPLEYRSLN